MFKSTSYESLWVRISILISAMLTDVDFPQTLPPVLTMDKNRC
jgi:hypothetical protein